MKNRFSFKILSKKDIPLIKEASGWHKFKYGYPVDSQLLEDSITQHLVKEEQDTYVIGCFNKDKLMGINTHVAWERMPFWTFAGLIIKPDDVEQGMMSSIQIYVLSEMLQFNCSLGEKNLRHDWITITQDSTHQARTRHYKIMDPIYEKYTSVDLIVTKPGEPIKYKFLEETLSFPHKKPLVVKMFSLKNELRPTSWLNSLN